MRAQSVSCMEIPGFKYVSTFANDKTPEELRETLLSKINLVLSSGSDEECAVCLESLTPPVITHCAHVFCKPCIFEVLRNEQINALMHALVELRRDSPAAKCLVVSQFTTFSPLIENPLKIRVCLYSFGWVSGTEEKNGSNLLFPKQPSRVLNCNAFVCESGWSWIKPDSSFPSVFNGSPWNPTAEDQFFDRSCRLGQKHNAVITKFIVKDSVEENILKIQNKKRELAAGAFATKNPSGSEIKQI